MSREKSNTLSKADIAAALSVIHDSTLTKVKAAAIMDTILELIQKGLEDGKTVDWYRMFKLTPEWKKAHKGHNPKTGEEIDVAAKWTVSMSLSEAVKSAVKNLPPPTL